MNDGFAWWLVILGIGVGVALVWLVMLRLPREEADVDPEELRSEAAWISRTIEAWGGVAPEPLVEEVLELHRQYLAGGTVDPNSVPDDALDELDASPESGPDVPPDPEREPHRVEQEPRRV